MCEGDGCTTFSSIECGTTGGLRLGSDPAVAPALAPAENGLCYGPPSAIEHSTNTSRPTHLLLNAAPGLVMFDRPQHANMPLDRCRQYDNTECDGAAANAWCKLQGLDSAVDIGDLVPSTVQRTAYTATNTSCQGEGCTTFASITCRAAGGCWRAGRGFQQGVCGSAHRIRARLAACSPRLRVPTTALPPHPLANAGTPPPIKFNINQLNTPGTNELRDAVWQLPAAATASSVTLGTGTEPSSTSVRIEFPAESSAAAADQLFAELSASPRPGWLAPFGASAVISSLSRGNLQASFAPAPPQEEARSFVAFATFIPITLASFGEEDFKADVRQLAAGELAGGSPRKGITCACRVHHCQPLVCVQAALPLADRPTRAAGS